MPLKLPFSRMNDTFLMRTIFTSPQQSQLIFQQTPNHNAPATTATFVVNHARTLQQMKHLVYDFKRTHIFSNRNRKISCLNLFEMQIALNFSPFLRLASVLYTSLAPAYPPTPLPHLRCFSRNFHNLGACCFEFISKGKLRHHTNAIRERFPPLDFHFNGKCFGTFTSTHTVRNSTDTLLLFGNVRPPEPHQIHIFFDRNKKNIILCNVSNCIISRALRNITRMELNINEKYVLHKIYQLVSINQKVRTGKSGVRR